MRAFGPCRSIQVNGEPLSGELYSIILEKWLAVDERIIANPESDRSSSETVVALLTCVDDQGRVIGARVLISGNISDV